MTSIISDDAKKLREYWVLEIQKLSGNFGVDATRLEQELRSEIASKGKSTLIDHLRLCGEIPESYGHDSSEEKLYSKYTDSLLCESFKSFGMRSLVIKSRGDDADVEAVGEIFSLVADAKSFRLSRTAKNQKDFKIQAMDGWKRGKPFAMVVCPIYQLPTRSSQVYHQASARNVCLFTFSHLSLLVSYSRIDGEENAQNLLHEILKVILASNPSKDANQYWLAVNRTIIGFSKKTEELWKIEKQAAIESLSFAIEEALSFLANERQKILQMSHDEVLQELLKMSKIEGRIKVISSVANNEILEIR